MKKLFVLAIAAGFFAACNNASSTTGDSTKIDSPAVVETPAPTPAPADSIPAGDSTSVDSSAAHH